MSTINIEEIAKKVAKKHGISLQQTANNDNHWALKYNNGELTSTGQDILKESRKFFDLIHGTGRFGLKLCNNTAIPTSSLVLKFEKNNLRQLTRHSEKIIFLNLKAQNDKMHNSKDSANTLLNGPLINQTNPTHLDNIFKTDVLIEVLNKAQGYILTKVFCDEFTASLRKFSFILMLALTLSVPCSLIVPLSTLTSVLVMTLAWLIAGCAWCIYQLSNNTARSKNICNEIFNELGKIAIFSMPAAWLTYNLIEASVFLSYFTVSGTITICATAIALALFAGARSLWDAYAATREFSNNEMLADTPNQDEHPHRYNYDAILGINNEHTPHHQHKQNHASIYEMLYESSYNKA